ncbi:hypothetical protein CR513_21787, partial [Mucuna pruriens]
MSNIKLFRIDLSPDNVVVMNVIVDSMVVEMTYVVVLVKEQPMFSAVRWQNLLFVKPEFLESSKQSIIQLWNSMGQPNEFSFCNKLKA